MEFYRGRPSVKLLVGDREEIIIICGGKPPNKLQWCLSSPLQIFRVSSHLPIPIRTLNFLRPISTVPGDSHAFRFHLDG